MNHYNKLSILLDQKHCLVLVELGDYIINIFYKEIAENTSHYQKYNNQV